MGCGISHTGKVSPVSEVKESKEDMEKISVKPDTIRTKIQHLFHTAPHLPYNVKLT